MVFLKGKNLSEYFTILMKQDDFYVFMNMQTPCSKSITFNPSITDDILIHVITNDIKMKLPTTGSVKINTNFMDLPAKRYALKDLHEEDFHTTLSTALKVLRHVNYTEEYLQA
jgi:hypothetical protein